MNWVDIVFFFYIFVGLYMSSLFLFIYIHNRKKLLEYPEGKPEPVSIVMPCYNEASSIGHAIESLLNLNYPKEMIEIIVVDDKSKDNSAEIVRKYVRQYSNIRLIVNKRNSGGAAEPTNLGVMAAKYKYIAVADSDSTPDRDTLIKMIGFLQQDKKVGAVTCAVLAEKPGNFIQRLQDMEYAVIAFTRKLLDCVDSVYVTPGPFALYRKEDLIKVGLFDTKNMTQDIEIVWRLLSHGYVARMCLATAVYSKTPKTLKAWWKQRIRWNIGGKQTLWKYKNLVFRKGMLGAFIIPFFSFSMFLGIFGFGLFVYLFTRRALVYYLSAKYSLAANEAVMRLQDLSFTPSVLNYLGFTLFFIGLAFTIFSLGVMKEKRLGKSGLFGLLFYSIVYLAIYPLVLLSSSYKMIRGNYSW